MHAMAQQAFVREELFHSMFVLTVCLMQRHMFVAASHTSKN